MRQTKKFIALLKNTIVAEFHTADGIDAVKKSLKKIQYDTIEEIPVDTHTHAGKNKNEYDKDWKLKPLPERVADGHVTIPEGHKLENDSFVPMNLQEKVDEGLIEIPEGMKIDGENFIEMTNAEKVTAGLMTQTEADNIEKEKLIQEKMNEILRAQAIEELTAAGKI